MTFLDDERFKKQPGSILCNKLRKEMDDNPNHWVSLDSALEFVNFYGIKGVTDMSCPEWTDMWMRLIAQEVLRAIDKAILDGYSMQMIKERKAT